MSDFQVLLFIGVPPSDTAMTVDGLQAELGDEGVVTCLHAPRLGPEGEAVRALIAQTLPDLICLFADDLEAQGDDVLAFCARMREEAPQYRPVVVVHSAASEKRRIRYLIQGADDMLSAQVSPEEFKVRLLVHLRRNLDAHVHEVTRLPGLQFTSRVIQRRINQGQSFAMLAVELDHFDVYGEVYGQLPAAQVLRTFAALLGRLVIFPDFVSHTEENTFVIVTHPDKTEKLSALLCRQFDTVAPNFYSEKDRKQGYIISIIANNISRRVPLLTLSIGISATTTQPFDSFMAAFNAAVQMKNLARMTPGYSWLSDKPRLAGSRREEMPQKPFVLVLEGDAALAFLLKTTLEMEGYEVEVASGLEDARQALAERVPNLLILDSILNGREDGLVLCREARERWPEVAIICTSSLHDRQQVLKAGADLYLPKPYELLSLFSWVHRLLARAA